MGMQIFLFSLQIRKFLGSDLYRKYTYFLGVPIRNRKFANFLLQDRENKTPVLKSGPFSAFFGPFMAKPLEIHLQVRILYLVLIWFRALLPNIFKQKNVFADLLKFFQSENPKVRLSQIWKLPHLRQVL